MMVGSDPDNFLRFINTIHPRIKSYLTTLLLDYLPHFMGNFAVVDNTCGWNKNRTQSIDIGFTLGKLLSIPYFNINAILGTTINQRQHSLVFADISGHQ